MAIDLLTEEAKAMIAARKRLEDAKKFAAAQVECPAVAANEREQITEDALKGGFKADAGKSRVDLIPPEVLLSLGDLFGMGALKYADDNWKLGMEFKRVYAALQRHILKWWAGEEYDPVDGQHHLDSVIWCGVVLRYYMLHYEEYKEFDSRFVKPVRAEEGNQK